jgi:hypothetical protein
MATIEQTTPPTLGEHGEPCASCGAPLAADQRYCVNCGERRADPRVDYAKHLGANGANGANGNGAGTGRSGGDRDLTPLLALGGLFALGVMLAVGVLIGKGGNSSNETAATPSVIHVQSGAGSTSGGTSKTASNTTGGAFKSDWPSGTTGYTVEIGAIDKAGSTPADVDAAKSQATSKGAPKVGALDSDQYGSLPGGKYIVYSGVYKSKPEATKALKPLKKNFPDATVVKVSQSSGGGGGGGGGATASSGGGGSIPANATQATDASSLAAAAKSGKTVVASHQALQQFNNLSGQDYENATKNIKGPISTGTGKPPPTDNKPAGGGSGGGTVIK